MAKVRKQSFSNLNMKAALKVASESSETPAVIEPSPKIQVNQQTVTANDVDTFISKADHLVQPVQQKPKKPTKRPLMIYVTPDTFDAITNRADSLNLSKSSYLNLLVQKDLQS